MLERVKVIGGCVKVAHLGILIKKEAIWKKSIVQHQTANIISKAYALQA